MRLWNSSKEQKEKTRVRLLELNKLKGHKIEVLDTLNNQTSVYSSIREAALSTGVARSTLGNALKDQEEKGVTRLIKDI